MAENGVGCGFLSHLIYPKKEGFLQLISDKINAKTGANEANHLVTGSKKHNMRTLPYSV